MSDPFGGHDGDREGGSQQPLPTHYAGRKQPLALSDERERGQEAVHARTGDTIDYHPLEKIQYRQVPAFRISTVTAQGTGEPEGVQALTQVIPSLGNILIKWCVDFSSKWKVRVPFYGLSHLIMNQFVST